MTNVEIVFINTLNGQKQKVQAAVNLTYGQIAQMESLAPPDVEWSVLDEEGNDITEINVSEENTKAYITPGRDIAGGY